MNKGTLVLIVTSLVSLVLATLLGVAILSGVLVSRLVDRDVAVEMFKAVIQVDGFLIGFGGVLATFVLAEARGIAFSVSEPKRVWVLLCLFGSAGFLLVSIMSSLSGMSYLQDGLLADSTNFIFPLGFLIFGVCYLCALASGAVVRVYP